MLQFDHHEEIPFSDERFPIRILWNKQITSSKSETEKLWHEQLEILYFLDGCAIVECHYEHLRTHAGDIVIINPCEPHTIIYAGEKATYHCLMIDAGIFQGDREDICRIKYLEPMRLQKLSFRNLVSDNQRIRTALEHLLGECQRKDDGYEMAVKGELFLLLSELFRNEVRPFPDPRVFAPPDKKSTRIEPALQFIRENYASKIGLDRLASACFLSRVYFCRLFRNTTGMKTTEYINSFRIAKAEALLLTTDLSITEVALRTGFEDVSYFSRTYQKLRKTTPKQFRTAARQTGKELL